MSTAPHTQSFGTLPDGTPAHLFTVTAGGVTATFTEYGARLVSLEMPDRSGERGHVVLGYSSVAEYVADRKTFMGAIVGRYGNRIAHGRFSLGGDTYQIPVNDGDNALHGGPGGFDRKMWTPRPLESGIEFKLISPDGDMGFPGTLTVVAQYTLLEAEQGAVLTIEYAATTDKETVVSVTNHAYFNLAGEGSSTILDHELEIPAEQYTPVDADLIPTGELAAVAGTPFDFRTPTRIGARIDEPNQQLKRGIGYDHNWAFGKTGVLKVAARVYEPGSGRILTVETSEPGVQFYSGNHMDGSTPNRVGGTYGWRSGFCLETQHYPDSPNQPQFPTTTLKPGETLRSTTTFTFGVRG